jgi:predicted lipoprotein with Yx(FWY)xxD motif
MRSSFKFLVPALAASLLLAACGSSSKSSGTSTQPTTTAAATPSSSSSGASASAAVVKTASNSTIGATVLVDSQGMTLYHLSGEGSGKFICTSSACVNIWHPLSATATVTPTGTVSSLGTVKRPDGTVQVAYKGEPLYTFAQDKQPGEANGQGIKDVGTWTVLTVGSKGSSSAPAATTPATTHTETTPSESSGGSSGGYGY